MGCSLNCGDNFQYEVKDDNNISYQYDVKDDKELSSYYNRTNCVICKKGVDYAYGIDWSDRTDYLLKYTCDNCTRVVVGINFYNSNDFSLGMLNAYRNKFKSKYLFSLFTYSHLYG